MQLARVPASLRHGIKMVNSHGSLMLSFRSSGKSLSEAVGENRSPCSNDYFSEIKNQ
jgi:hypothetical protein